MNDQVNIQHNKLMKLDYTMLMYGIFNAETLEKLINTVHEIHNATSPHEKLFAGEQKPFTIQDALHRSLRHTAICN